MDEFMAYCATACFLVGHPPNVCTYAARRWLVDLRNSCLKLQATTRSRCRSPAGVERPGAVLAEVVDSAAGWWEGSVWGPWAQDILGSMRWENRAVVRRRSLDQAGALRQSLGRPLKSSWQSPLCRRNRCQLREKAATGQ